jgi:hypothetical protein
MTRFFIPLNLYLFKIDVNLSYMRLKYIAVPLIFIIILLLFPSILLAEDKVITDSHVKGLSASTDLHFTGKYCEECHVSVPAKGQPPSLKFNGNFTQLCWCHGYTSGTYIHPVDVVPSEQKKNIIPENMPLSEGKLVCSTCHEIYAQCQNDKRTKVMNGKFLRGAPYPSRTTICFKCHSRNQYQMLDPHNQLDEDGDIIKIKCLYCHKKLPDVKTSRFEDIELIGNMVLICKRCHAGVDRHPSGQNHLRVPSAKTLKVMKDLEVERGVILPLDYEGKLTCATCHNPHERGVIPSTSQGARGASEKFRHRVSSGFCNACHNK